jgi:hypothetical protein
VVTKLTITPCTVDTSGTVTGVESSKTFTVMLNPSSFKHSKSITYTGRSKKDIPQGVSAITPQFKNTGNEKVSFLIVLDGTGVVAGKFPAVKTQIQSLNDVVYKYEGDSHEPSIVRLVWGSFSFDGRLTSMDAEYTLFKSTGEPLRAKVSLSFTDYVSIKEEALKANKTSPDLTHLVEVKAGDSLPLLCHRIYKNSAYYLDVAKSNGITNFRNIKPGTKLHFPPLR